MREFRFAIMLSLRGLLDILVELTCRDDLTQSGVGIRRWSFWRDGDTQTGTIRGGDLQVRSTGSALGKSAMIT